MVARWLPAESASIDQIVPNLNALLGVFLVFLDGRGKPMSDIRNVSPSDAAKFAALRVLLVDDHPHIRSIITGILNALGIVNVTTAERGDIALNYMAKAKYDVLITDYEMPGMSGIAIAKAVRKDARSATPNANFAIPILMITGNVTRERLHEVRDAGIDEILAKPFTVLGVADRLNSIVNKRREFIVCEAYIGPCRRRTSKTAYVGPKRRDSDLVELPAFEIEQEYLLVRQEARSLCKFAQAGSALGFGEREAVIATALAAAQRAKRIRDSLLERVCMSLAKYVQWAANGSPVDCSVVDSHGQSILELLDGGKRDPRISEQIVHGLEDMVARKTSQRAA
jgi:CheY-like chemotaxis protein